MRKLILSIDMGGTTAKIAVADKQGKILHKFVVNTKWGDEAVPFYNQEIRKYLKEKGINYEQEIEAIGFGCVGPIDQEKGLSINANKIGWVNYPIREVATNLFKKPIFLINDARSIAYGEWKAGAGRAYHSFIIFSIGTGIGGGLVLNNQIYKGAHNTSGEFEHGGHHEVEHGCGCGLRHCIGGLSTAVGIERYFQKFIVENPGSSLAKLQKKLKRNIHIKDVSELIKAYDPDATKALSYTLKPLAAKISTLLYAIDPQAVLIGGGPSALGQPLIDIIKSHLKLMTWPAIFDNVDIKLCELKNDAGIVGVTAFTLDSLKELEKGSKND